MVAIDSILSSVLSQTGKCKPSLRRTGDGAVTATATTPATGESERVFNILHAAFDDRKDDKNICHVRVCIHMTLVSGGA